MKKRKPFHPLLLTTSAQPFTPKQLPPFLWLTTPLSFRRGAGGEALFPFPRFAKGLGLRLRGAVLEALFPTFLLNNYCISFHSYMVSLTREKAFGNLLCKEYIPDWRLTELT